MKPERYVDHISKFSDERSVEATLRNIIANNDFDKLNEQIKCVMENSDRIDYLNKIDKLLPIHGRYCNIIHSDPRRIIDCVRIHINRVYRRYISDAAIKKSKESMIKKAIATVVLTYLMRNENKYLVVATLVLGALATIFEIKKKNKLVKESLFLVSDEELSRRLDALTYFQLLFKHVADGTVNASSEEIINEMDVMKDKIMNVYVNDGFKAFMEMRRTPPDNPLKRVFDVIALDDDTFYNVLRTTTRKLNIGNDQVKDVLSHLRDHYYVQLGDDYREKLWWDDYASDIMRSIVDINYVQGGTSTSVTFALMIVMIILLIIIVKMTLGKYLHFSRHRMMTNCQQFGRNPYNDAWILSKGQVSV